MLNIEKMFVLIAARPQIRTVEIADIIDCDVEQVQPALQPHVDCGDLTLIEVTAPNGRPANGFMVTRQFIDGELHKALLPAIQAQRVADGWMVPAPAAPRPIEKLPAAPIVPRIVEPRPRSSTPRTAAPPAKPYDRSATQKAIDHLAVHGPCRDKDLREPMGLSSKQYPAAQLRWAINDGRIVRDGDFFMLPGSVPPAPFRVARWPDGSIDIHRDGKVAITIAPEECLLLAPAIEKTVMRMSK